MADIFRLICKGEIPKLDELGPDGFIWIPLTSIPIDEHYRINSLEQPALKMFQLLSWDALSPCATDEQEYLRKLALAHAEMGYFLLHYKNIFGIIGVEEYRDGRTPGRAVIFNCVERDFWPRKDNIIELDLIYSKLKYPCDTLIYRPGEFSNYGAVRYKAYTGPESLDD